MVIVGTLVAANAVAWVPGRRAARLRPAVVLRSE
jgi:ABC-type lipoprotein release transport system permease subunit